jgi:hypothetical protein
LFEEEVIPSIPPPPIVIMESPGCRPPGAVGVLPDRTILASPTSVNVDTFIVPTVPPSPVPSTRRLGNEDGILAPSIASCEQTPVAPPRITTQLSPSLNASLSVLLSTETWSALSSPVVEHLSVTPQPASRSRRLSQPRPSSSSSGATTDWQRSWFSGLLKFAADRGGDDWESVTSYARTSPSPFVAGGCSVMMGIEMGLETSFSDYMCEVRNFSLNFKVFITLNVVPCIGGTPSQY